MTLVSAPEVLLALPRLPAVEALPVVDPLRQLPGLERELQHTWMVWDTWVAGRRRVDLHPFVLDRRSHERAIEKATRAWQLVKGAAERAGADPAERALYKLHPDVDRLAAASRRAGDFGAVARVDLLLREDGEWIACEVNADCPGGYNETVALPRLARQAGLGRRVGSYFDPSTVAFRLADALVAKSGGPGSPNGIIALVYATAYAEDLQICALLEKLVKDRGGRAARMSPTAISQLLGNEDAISYKGERISVVYRFYPLEYMAGQKNIDAIERATAAGNLLGVSSFACIYAQSKLAMARAFDHDPLEAADVFPETRAFDSVSRERLERERESWVLKRDLSRVGDHVFVGALIPPDEWPELLVEVEAVQYLQPIEGDRTETSLLHDREQVWIAQKFIPQKPLASPWGPRLVTLGVYLLEGVFAGYFARLSESSHCSHDALVLPVIVAEDVIT